MSKKIGLLIVSVLIVMIFAFSSLSSKEKPITVSGGVTSESQILGNIVVQLLSYYLDEEIVFYNNLGSPHIMHAAMLKGDLDIAAPRYTGTELMGTLGLEPEKDPDKAQDIVQREFKSRFDFKWFPSYGFSNEYTFMVTEETAAKYDLKTVSDLRAYADQLKVGSDQTWYKREAGDGYKAFTEVYDMTFNQVYPMQVGLLYDALISEDLDVVLGYSTDGRVLSYNLVMLEDDRQFFPPYTASLVAAEALLLENEEIEPILNALAGTIDTLMMQKLNDESDRLLIEPAVIAETFLKSHNYFEDVINSK